MGAKPEVDLDDIVVGGSLMHSDEPKPDFGGYATKAGLRCSDGRTIMPDAFKHQDTMTVPLVWQHNHSDPANVLGHAVLEHREDGMYSYAYFNDTPQGVNAKKLVQHKDIVSLSIYANELVEKSKKVLHGVIRELSLVLSGANPGALIDNITLQHNDGEMAVLEDEAVIYTGLELRHSDEEDSGEKDDDGPTVQDVYDSMSDEQKEVVHHMVGAALEDKPGEATHADKADPTVQDVYDSMTDDQKNVVHYLVGAALENTDAGAAATHSDDNSGSELVHTNDDKEGQSMETTTRNVFEQKNKDKKSGEEKTLSHDAMVSIVDTAKRTGSLKEAIESYALQHGIEDIEILFPDARTVTDTPEFNARRVEWVTGVLNGTRHSPFSRVKSLIADLTYGEARAKGYIKGNLKKEEWFSVSKRVTTPGTVYKKQKLDRDDIIDITDFDVVVWLKAEMRLMFDEELARAILIGDGREFGDDDKIKDPAGAPEGAGIRSILHDHDLYAPTFMVDDSATGFEISDEVTRAMGFYKGSGSPTFYTTGPVLTNILLTRDQFNHRLWKNKEELALELGVSEIVTVEVMEDESDLLGIIVNLRDYTVGTDKGGEMSFFDFFDIDYNQYKYLYESRLSGALTKIRSALVIKRAATGGTLALPLKPEFDGVDITVPTVTGVLYYDKSDDTPADLSGSTVTLDADTLSTMTIVAVADTGYYFENNVQDEWKFTFDT